MISLTSLSESRLDPVVRPAKFSRLWLVGLIVVSILSGLYVWQGLSLGWVPHDEGTLAHSAERVLQGQLPHRDFDDVYTGGLSYGHAMALRWGGISLVSIRLMLFLAFLIWVPAVYFIATRWATIPVGVLVTLLAVIFSVPNYSAALPSWYNLFLATFGLAALLRYLETQQRRWIFIAGICGGLSLLVKIVGLYFVAAVGLTLLFWEQSGLGKSDSTEDSDGPTPERNLSQHLLKIVVLLGLLAFVATMFWVYGRLFPARAFVALVLPAVAPALILIQRELRLQLRLPAQRLQTLWYLSLPFAAGLLLVVAPFLIHYSLQGALGDLYQGLFVDPVKRLQFAAIDTQSLPTLLTAVIPIGLLAWSPRWKISTRYLVAGLLTLPMGFVLFHSYLMEIYQLVFHSFRWWVPISVVAGSLVLLRRAKRTHRSPLSDHSSTALFALLAGAGLCNLVQFPFAAPIYFFYVAPLAILTLLAVLSCQASGPRPVLVTLALFYMLFCGIWVNRGFIYRMGTQFIPNSQTELLDIDRGGIRVGRIDKEIYEPLIALIREKARGEHIWATPDCPQIYFLSGYQNPTPTLFDFFDDPDGRDARILQTLTDNGVNLVVFNQMPHFSGPPSPSLLTELRDRYPLSETLAQFEVRWRP